MSPITIIHATTPAHFDAARTLFREYAQHLGEDLCFQGFDEELKTLPGKYAPPRGALLLAVEGEAVAGCVALRPLDGTSAGEGVCEMKRLFVRDAYRGRGLGRRLAEEIIAEAQSRGYRRLVLDTLDRLAAATSLYRALGFDQIPAYYHNPLADVTYWALELGRE